MAEEIGRHQYIRHTESLPFAELITLFFDTRTNHDIRMPFRPDPPIPRIRHKAFDLPLMNKRKPHKRTIRIPGVQATIFLTVYLVLRDIEIPAFKLGDRIGEQLVPHIPTALFQSAGAIGGEVTYIRHFQGDRVSSAR